MVSEEWQALIDQKRADRSAQIPEEWRLPESITIKVSADANISAFDLLKEADVFSPREIEITERYDATALLEEIAKGRVTAYEVAKAFCKRAAVGHQLTNALTEIFFDKALQRARWLDDYFATEGKTVGPLHGLPISIKDMFMVEGEYATLGFISYLKKPRANENSVVVDILHDAGAVFYCKTNVPQTLFVVEGVNNVFGRTLSPHKLTLSPGGSSAGEGALLGIRGSLMGLGSDIAGSIRLPAAINGLFGFKPTVGRLPWAKQQEFIPKGLPGPVQPTLGPLAHSARDLTLFTKTVIQAKPWMKDSTALAVRWNDVEGKPTLTIGVWENDPEFAVFPPMERFIKTAVEKLKAAGHTIKLINPAPSVVEGTKLAFRSLGLDTGPSAFEPLKPAGEEPIPEVAVMDLSKLWGSDYVADLAQVWSVNCDLEDYREEWAQVWRREELDVLLCPPARGTAQPHGEFGVPMYTAIWNLLDCPASVIPFSKVDAKIDSRDGYDASSVDGAPGSVQIVGWRFQDEEVLMATEVIADALA